MADTNPTPATPGGAPAPNRMKVLVLVLAAAVVVLGGLLVYQISQNNQQTEEITELTNERSDLVAEIDGLNNQIVTLEQELQETSLDAEQKQAKIEEYLRKISALQAKANEAIAQNRVQGAELQTLRERLDVLNFQFNKLTAENARLRDENTRLTGENQQLQGQVQQLNQQSQELQQTVQQTQQQVQEMSNPITVADFSYVSYDGSRENAGSVIKRPWLKSKLKVCVVVNANTTVRAGQRDAFLVIKGPTGQVINSMSTSSGRFQAQGQELIYSAKSSFNYTGSRLTPCFEYVIPAGQEFDKGSYSVEVFIDGQRAGANSFLVRSAL
jgi:uncharacterized protein YlxW (UPF0749 family)